MIQIYYWDIKEQKEITIDSIRKKLPNASIPDNCNLDGIGYFKILDTQIPLYNKNTHAVRYSVKRVDNIGTVSYVKEWEVYPLPEEEVLANKAEQERKVQEIIVKKAQENLDNFAQSGGYDSILSACTYINSLVPKFAEEANKCIQLRDAYWSKAYEILEDVLAGNRPTPSCFDDIKDELPVLTWR